MTTLGWRGLAASAVWIAVLGSGCAHVAEADPPEGDAPAEVTAIPGEQDLAEVTLTEEAARNLGIRTEPVRKVPEGLAVPSSAVQYLPEGDAFVYTSPERFAYLRVGVVVLRDSGPTTTLSEGPEPGTRVVSVGAAQIYGTEFEIDGEG